MGNMFKGAKPFLFVAAEKFRKMLTTSEEKLWIYLRKKPLGIRFRRQHPYLLYILDFYVHSIKLVIEVDGGIHELEDVMENDIRRQGDIERTGLNVLKITNNEIQNNFPEVILRIQSKIMELNHPPL